jgi:hypothetical protein
MSMRLYDNTRLSAYKRCPRYYFFRHVMHWETTGLKTALVFGSSWHAAMDVIWSNIKTVDRNKLAHMAWDAFVQTWMDAGMPAPGEIDYEMEKELAPRTPSHAMEMIVAYIDNRAKTAGDFELIHTERPFAVPIDPADANLFYVGKIDKVVRRRGKIMGIEHKTTTAYKKDGPFRSAFLDSFSPNSQVDGYLYTLHMMFPGEVGGVWVDASLVHKQEEGFQFIPIERQLAHLDTWLWEVRWWINIIEDQMAALNKHCSPDDPYMRAFPKNTNSCFDFNTACAYHLPCKSWPNPLRVGSDDKPPSGYIHSIWDPLEHIEGLEKVTTEEKSTNAKR